MTVVCEPARRARGRRPAQTTRVLAVSEGKDAQALEVACESLVERGLEPEGIVQVCADMSPAYAKGVRTSFPLAELVFDFFHVVGLITEGVDPRCFYLERCLVRARKGMAGSCWQRSWSAGQEESG